MAQGNHNLDEALRLLSKEVDFRTFAKLKALTNSSDSEFLNGQLFEYFRKRQGDIPFSEVLSLPSEANNPVKTRLLSWLVRWRRLLEPWEGEALHSIIGELKWGLSRGMGEDLAEYLAKAMQLAEKQANMPAILEILGLERQTVLNYWATSENRIQKLELISSSRQLVIKGIMAGQTPERPNKPPKAKVADLSHRVKSDLLFRLCNTLSDKECEELKRHIQLHRKDAKQFRLLEYYRQMPEWSRDQEKKDWESENLSRLKSNTLAWLMRNMARYGEWQGTDLHHLLGDIKWAISKGIGQHLESHFQRALVLAKEIEAHEVLFELHAIGKQYFGETVDKLDSHDWAFRQLQEVEIVHSLRLQYFEPIRIQNRVAGQNRITAWQTFQVVLADAKWEGLSASAARRELLKLRILTCISLSDHIQGKSAAKEMLRLHQTRPQVATLSWVRYFEELRLCCLALVLAGSHEEAIEIVHHIGQLETSDKATIPHAVLQRLLALSYVYDATSDPVLAELGLTLFGASRIQINRLNDNPLRVWLLSFIGKAALDLGRFATSKEALNEILDNKVLAPPLLIAHSRVRLLLALLGSKVESEVIVHAANACLVYLKRNETAPKYLQHLVLLVKKVSQLESGSKEQIVALEKAAIDSEKYLTIEAQGQGFNLNYPHVFRKVALEVK